jgi:hypothetical protein
MNTNPKAPHKAILAIRLEVHNLLPTGECSGHPLTNQELDEYNLKPKFTLTINGFDKHECLRKLSELISQFERQ